MHVCVHVQGMCRACACTCVCMHACVHVHALIAELGGEEHGRHEADHADGLSDDGIAE